MRWYINEIFSSIQGEGRYQGCPATFIRFAGCNMHCEFCDTNFKKSKPMTGAAIIKEVKKLSTSLIVITGGEPALQKPDELARELTLAGYRDIAIETNGSIYFNTEWFNEIACSPKISIKKLKVPGDAINTIKLLYPYIEGAEADKICHHVHNWVGLQPKLEKRISDKKRIAETIKEVQRLGFPWRLSLQAHKLIGVK